VAWYIVKMQHVGVTEIANEPCLFMCTAQSTKINNVLCTKEVFNFHMTSKHTGYCSMYCAQ